MKVKSNNPANIASAEAKKAGLSYWQYMEKHYPGTVQHHDWNAPKPSGDRDDRMLNALTAMKGKLGLKFLAGIRSLVSGRGY